MKLLIFLFQDAKGSIDLTIEAFWWPYFDLKTNYYDPNLLDLVVGAAAGGFVLIMGVVLVVCMVKMRNARKKQEEEDVDDNPTYGLYYEVPTESKVVDENDYYGTS